jgi:hypothetical protein
VLFARFYNISVSVAQRKKGIFSIVCEKYTKIFLVKQTVLLYNRSRMNFLEKSFEDFHIKELEHYG